MKKFTFYFVLVLIEIAVILIGSFSIMNIFINKAHMEHLGSAVISPWIEIAGFILVIAAVIFAVKKIIKKFSLKKYSWQGIIVRFGIIGIIVFSAYIYDVIEDRKHVIRVYQDTDLFSESDSLEAKKIGVLPMRSEVKVLRINYGKDYMRVKVESESQIGWVETSQQVRIYNLDMNSNYTPLLTQAEADFESVKAGYKPVFAHFDEARPLLADGGTSYYKGAGYKLEIKQTMSVDNNKNNGFLYGPIITFDSTADGNPSKVLTDVKFYKTEDFKKLKGE